MADLLTLAALGLSAVALVAVLALLVTGRGKGGGTVSDPGDLAGTIREVKGSVSDLHQTEPAVVGGGEDSAGDEQHLGRDDQDAGVRRAADRERPEEGSSR